MQEMIDIHFGGQMDLYLSQQVRRENYDIYLSDVIGDEYWNFTYLKKNDISLLETWQAIKEEMQSAGKRPIIYITSEILDANLQEQIQASNLQPLYTDVWMTLKNLEQLVGKKSSVEFSTSIVEKTQKDQVIQAVLDGFSGDDPEDPYQSLEEGYRIALEKSFEPKDHIYQVLHYFGRKGEEVIATATVIYRKEKGIIYNITTNKKYQKKGVCKQMLSEIAQDLMKKNIQEVCVQTEQGFYTEQVYKKMGFCEQMLGRAYTEKE